nr:MAG TPA: hypothetical protein [Caudoviricetes sp.]
MNLTSEAHATHRVTQPIAQIPVVMAKMIVMFSPPLSACSISHSPS